MSEINEENRSKIIEVIAEYIKGSMLERREEKRKNGESLISITETYRNGRNLIQTYPSIEEIDEIISLLKQGLGKLEDNALIGGDGTILSNGLERSIHYVLQYECLGMEFGEYKRLRDLRDYLTRNGWRDLLAKKQERYQFDVKKDGTYSVWQMSLKGEDALDPIKTCCMVAPDGRVEYFEKPLHTSEEALISKIDIQTLVNSTREGEFSDAKRNLQEKDKARGGKINDAQFQQE